MNRKQYLLLVVLTIVSALIGGVVFNWIFAGGTVRASDAGEEKIVAERFELVDKEGKIRGFFGVKNASPGLFLYNNDGNCPIALSLVSGERPALSLFDNTKSIRATFTLFYGHPVLALLNKDGEVTSFAPHTP